MMTKTPDSASKHTIALIQLTSGDDVDANLSEIREFVKSAAERGIAMVFLPECCALMQTSRAQLRDCAEKFTDGPIQATLIDIAKQHRVMLFAGSIPLVSEDPQRVYNSSLVFDSNGACIARYDKVHLFDVALDNGEQYLESAYTMAGNNLSCIDSDLGRIGLSVCYDLRFPELYRALAAEKAELILVP
ncbi:MAG: hypothetical protein KTR18_10165, partial [Acidiferrobacterales bacterium]|nr:hypothetical protein [Acidiferrobacterales bacterium]